MKNIFAAFRSIMPLLPSDARRYIKFYIVCSSALALLDVLALMLLAASLSSMVQSNPVVLPVVGTIEPDSFGWLLLVVCGLILLKSVLALLLQWRATRRMATFELAVGDHLFSAYIRAPWEERLKRNTAQLVRLADVGIGNVTNGFLNPIMSTPALIITSVCVIIVIAVVQPITAVITVVYLGMVALLLYVVLSRRTIQAGRVNRDYSLKVASLMTDMVGALKEITLRGKSDEVARVVHSNRIRTSQSRANISFLAGVPRFVLDIALIGGIVLVGGSALLIGGMENAVSAVALFAVAGFRLVPSITGFQALLNTMNANVPHVQAVISDIHDARRYTDNAEHIGGDEIDGDPQKIVLKDIAFTYPNADAQSLRDVSGTISLGRSLGIVGSSGAGKSTLVDVLLGLLKPSAGELRLGDQALEDVMQAWRARVGYVPQDVSLFDGSVAQNVALTWEGEVDDERVRDCLRRAHVLDVVESRVGGIHTSIGDRGMRLSGGQRQRLGIARALYADPLVLVLDEATSSLDSATEVGVSQAIRELSEGLTVISIAHRLSTIKDSDEVWFMRDGSIAARGTFSEVVASEPEFAHQARLAGLT